MHARYNPLQTDTPNTQPIQFGKLARKGKVRPAFPDPTGEAARIAARVRERQQQFEALESALETDKAELRQMVSPFFFEHNQQKLDPDTTIEVAIAGDDPVQLQFQNRYPAIADREALAAVLTEAQLSEFFVDGFQIKIDGEALPQDRAQEFVDELVALAERFHCTEAFQVKQGLKPRPEFHARRHSILSVPQNLALHQSFANVTAVKTSATRKKG